MRDRGNRGSAVASPLERSNELAAQLRLRVDDQNESHKPLRSAALTPGQITDSGDPAKRFRQGVIKRPSSALCLAGLTPLFTRFDGDFRVSFLALVRHIAPDCPAGHATALSLSPFFVGAAPNTRRLCRIRHCEPPPVVRFRPIIRRSPVINDNSLKAILVPQNASGPSIRDLRTAVIGPEGEDPTTIEFARLLAAEIGGFVPPPTYSKPANRQPD